MDIFDKYYTIVVKKMIHFSHYTIPYFRRVLRFIALPYAYFLQVNWRECPVSWFQVMLDFSYIFFILKDYPDHYTELRLRVKNMNEWKYYYGSMYNPYQRRMLRKEVQKKEYEILFEDKNICNQLCLHANLPVPEFLGYIEPQNDIINVIKNLLENPANEKIIIKAARGKGGKDIFVAYKKNNNILVSDSRNEIELSAFKLEFPSIIQKYIVQHPEIGKISSSVNTIRTETLLTRDNDVVIIGALMRFGLNNNFVDNFCVGGLTVGIDCTKGTLVDFAINNNAEKFYKHPDTGFEFYDFRIPFWDEVIELSKRIQRNFSYFKLLGPDIAITPDGPIIIEINATPDHVGIEMNSGPSLKNKRIWEEFKNYDLLINNASRKLH